MSDTAGRSSTCRQCGRAIVFDTTVVEPHWTDDTPDLAGTDCGPDGVPHVPTSDARSSP